MGLRFSGELQLTQKYIEEYDRLVVSTENNSLYIEELDRQIESYENGNNDETIVHRLIREKKIREESLMRCTHQINVFERSWQSLCREDQVILYEIHRNGKSREQALEDLSEILGYSETTIKRHYKRSLTRLCQMLSICICIKAKNVYAGEFELSVAIDIEAKSG